MRPILAFVSAPVKRSAGILLPAFSPRRKDDLGIGDTLSLREWIDWAAAHQVGFIQLLPINENGPDESPYSAISSIALDPIYLALDASEIPGLTAADVNLARSKLGEAKWAKHVDYPAVREVKRDLLEIAWSRFNDAKAILITEFHCFKNKHAEWLADYCIFRYLMELHGDSPTWDQWPSSCNTPGAARAFLAQQCTLDAALVAHRLDYYAFVQWLCFRQWLALRTHAEQQGVKLMGDMPIGISYHSCDVFFQPDEFHHEWCGGTPPEGMGEQGSFLHQWGQNWGIPLYRWDQMAANDYRWWKNRIKHLTAIFSIFRLDHILGFYRIYAFPWNPSRNSDFVGLNHEQAAAINAGRLPHWVERADDTPENKAANRADGDPRLRAIVEAAGDAEIIAEDLGWVPEYVRPHLADLGIAGFRIPHWDCNDQGQPTLGNFFPENSFAAYSTHDHDPVNGIWRGCLHVIQQHAENPTDQSGCWIHGAHAGLRILSEFAGIPLPQNGPWPPYTEGIRLRLIKALFSSNSRYATLMITELFDLDARINHPGTSGEQNWRFRLPWTLAEIEANPHLNATCQKLSTLISITRRC